MQRRKFISILGGGMVLAAGTAAAGFAMTRTPTKALAPWADAGGSYNEPRRRALSYAILAPNPHNRQPWMVDLSVPDEITLFVDTDRLLPWTDPYGRQITIGLGCFLEILRMAAADDGYGTDVQQFPMGFDSSKLDDRPVATIRFHRDAPVQKDPLFRYVLARRSHKEPYDQNKSVPDGVLANLTEAVGRRNAVGATNDPAKVRQLRKLTHDAMAIEIATPRTYKESVDLFRIGRAEVEANPDGIDFSGVFFESLSMTGMFTREKALDPNSPTYQQGIDAVMAQGDTAMGHVWLVTPGNTRLDQLSAGRDWVRINLAATVAGVGTQPLSQALQEYPEMKDLYAQVHELLAPNGGTVQMLGRLGYAAPVAAAPRWPLDAKIMKA